jgi:WD40-like Beta Propeller Repeat
VLGPAVVRLSVTAILVLLLSAAPAAARLVYQRPHSHAIVAAHNDGSDPRVIAHGIAPVISPDGKRVAFFRPSVGDELRLVSIHGGKSRLLSHDALVMDPSPVFWSPDSSRLLMDSGRGDAFLFDVRNHTQHRYWIDSLGGAAFSPDGSELLLAYGGGDRYLPTLHLFRIGKHGRHDLRTGGWPVWSALGVAYFQDPDRIRFAKRPEVRPHDVAHSGRIPVAVSANGRRILLGGSNQGPGGYQALLVDPITEKSHTLAPLFTSVNCLSRDGRHVLGVVDGNVVSVNRRGTVRVLVPQAAQPSWNK